YTFVCLAARRPWGAPPFPYTTLFRSEVVEQLLAEGVGRTDEPQWTGEIRDEENRIKAGAEEGMSSDASPIHPQRFAREIRDYLEDRKHTSELQSLAYLVCRLLLEKKK